MDDFFSEESRKQLIISVQQHPILYDKSMEAYHSKAARYHAWVEVAKMCGRPGRGTYIVALCKRQNTKFCLDWLLGYYQI